MVNSNDNCLLEGYTPEMNFWNSPNKDKCVAIGGANINISNFDYNNASDFKTAMNDHYLIFLVRNTYVETI